MSIRVQHIAKRFGSFTALDDVSLDFATGELVALLGPSGCGKTTLLRIIAGLEHADSGCVLLDGSDATGADVRQRRIGFVFQHYALFRHMSVFDNVAFGLRVKPRRDRPSSEQIRQRVRHLLELVQLEHLAERLPAQLSGGQRQRVALARALAVEPRVLLLDEPFGALDAKVRKELRRWLRTLHDELHVTSVFVTHDQQEALEVADQVVLMNAGRIEQVGTPAEVYDRPATSFAFDFLGDANRFCGRLHGGLLQVGQAMLPVASGASESAAQVEAVGFARPHELEIVMTGSAGPTGSTGATDATGATGATEAVPARIVRILPTGSSVRIELVAIADQTVGQHFEVELSHGAAQRLRLIEGQSVGLRPTRLHVFDTAASAAA